VVKTANDHDGCDFVIDTENDFFAISNDLDKIRGALSQRIKATPKCRYALTLEDKEYNPYQGSYSPEKTWYILQFHKREETF
jgi:hypothetical protein